MSPLNSSGEPVAAVAVSAALDSTPPGRSAESLNRDKIYWRLAGWVVEEADLGCSASVEAEVPGCEQGVVVPELRVFLPVG